MVCLHLGDRKIFTSDRTYSILTLVCSSFVSLGECSFGKFASHVLVFSREDIFVNSLLVSHFLISHKFVDTFLDGLRIVHIITETVVEVAPIQTEHFFSVILWVGVKSKCSLNPSDYGIEIEPEFIGIDIVLMC